MIFMFLMLFVSAVWFLSDGFLMWPAEAKRHEVYAKMAEEMIAPLLRDWMENNLPTLVERLVREEIERVARGAQ